ncbi:MAG: chemotaxis protein CheW [Actinobacteria bacterium]|nr:chemotaxis protein CheW [Actinomycetota bacterium]
MTDGVEHRPEAGSHAEVDDGSGWTAVLLPVGRDWYAIDVAVVREVVAQPLLRPVPTAPPAVLGVFNLRGEIVPLFDTAVLLGREPVNASPFAAVLQARRGSFALATTDVPRSARLGDPAAAELPGSLISFAVGDQLATLLEPELALALIIGGETR